MTSRRSRTDLATYEQPAADYYEPLAGWRGYSYAQRRCRLLPKLIGRVLDVGCGDGRVVLTALGDRGVGLDPSATMLAAAWTRAPFAGLIRGVGEDLPLANASFDTVLVSHALWLFAEPSSFLAEARRVLRPASRLVVVSNHAHYFAARRVVLGVLGLLGRRHHEPPPLLHRQSDVEARLAEAGFEHIRSERFLVLPIPGFAWLDRTPLKRLGLSFVTEAKAPA